MRRLTFLIAAALALPAFAQTALPVAPVRNVPWQVGVMGFQPDKP